jgi:iron complex transport system substrate-binding protein
MIGLCGCDQADVTERDSPATVNITDCAGRQVEIPAKIERVACLCPEAAYTLAMFGQGDKMVAVAGGVKRDMIMTDLYPGIKDLPVPKSSGVINIEELIGTRPDVVFVKRDTSGSEAETEKLEKVKIPFLVVDYNSIEEQLYAVEMIGQVIGENEKAQQYKEYYQDCIKRAQDRIQDIDPQQRVRVYHSFNEATRTDVAGSLSDDWLKAAGAYNVSGQAKLKLLEGKYYAGLEQILLWDPEIILVNEMGVDDYIMTNKQWASLQAVKNKKVYKLPSGISRWGHPSSPETPLVILWTAKTLYPERFNDLDMAQECRSFYKEFFGLELSDEVIQNILFGEGMRAARE